MALVGIGRCPANGRHSCVPHAHRESFAPFTASLDVYRFVGRPPTRRRGLTCRRCKRGCASAARDVGEKLVGTPWERRGNRASIVGKDRTAPINTPGSRLRLLTGG